MTGTVTAFVGADIHDGAELHRDAALIAYPDGRADIVSPRTLPASMSRQALPGGTIAPGFVDLQANGGGGVMFNDDQSVEALRIIAEAHASIGTAALLPTLITDTAERTKAAISAVDRAIADQVPGIIGVHLEGPHLSVARKGAHDPDLIRPMAEMDMRVFLEAADRLANVKLTVAPENTTCEQISALSKAGIIVSLGHTDANYDTCMRAFDAGARCVTHLFNAMSQLGNREPGLVGAALSHGEVYVGLIADGIHVHPASMRAALAAKTGTERVFLVTDAMATGGSDITEFTLNHRRVLRQNGRLTLENGTLAGADLELTHAISVLVNDVGQPLESAIARATSTPGELLREKTGFGRFTGRTDGLIYLDPGLSRVQKLSDLR